MCEVMKSFICRGCSNPVISTGHTSVEIGASANLEVVDKFCYLGDMLSADEDAAVEARIEMDGINSGSWYHCSQLNLIFAVMVGCAVVHTPRPSTAHNAVL